MKKILILLAIVLMSICSVCDAFSQNARMVVQAQARRAEPPSLRSAMSSPVVVGYQWDDAVTLNWGSWCPSMDIIILNVATSETVYSETKVIQTGDVTKINTQNLKPGEYEIQLLPNGRLSVTMSFEIE